MTHEQGRRELPAFGAPIGKPQKVQAIHSKPFLPEVAHELVRQLEAHGCTVQPSDPHWTITFPAGTLRQEYFPRTSEEHCELTLPDGYQLEETIKRDGLSYLAFLPDGFSSEFVQYHQQVVENVREQRRQERLRANSAG